MRISTEAWVLKTGQGSRVRGNLEHSSFEFEQVGDDLALVEPIYGSWEANMEHALSRSPVDICVDRGEDSVVLGNGGVARVLQVGPDVRNVKVGDVCIVFGNDRSDEFGFMEKALGYDSKGSMGVLAKKVVLRSSCLIPIPSRTRYSLKQWAAFSLRYVTAWSNWKVAYAAWCSQRPDGSRSPLNVWGWGGGTPFAELKLAQFFGAQTAMMASTDSRLEYIERAGIVPIDRRQFLNLSFDAKRFREDDQYRDEYLQAENCFVDVVKKKCGSDGVSIFVDYIGAPVFRASLRALGRQGVLTSAGWKQGMNTAFPRAVECIRRHIHVYTHFANYSEGVDAVRFAEEKGWMPPDDLQVYAWADIPKLVTDYRAGVAGYFPLFEVNPE